MDTQRIAAISLIFLVASTTAAALSAQTIVDLPADGADVVLDERRDLLYVSLPDDDEVLRISASTYQVLDSLYVGDRPWGLELGRNGGTLYAALNDTGSVGIHDLDTGDLEIIDIEAELGHRSAYDVSQAMRDRLFVSASPRGGGFAWIVAVDLEPGFPAERVASDDIIRCAPTFEKTHDDTALYVGACFNPNSLYKLDLLDPEAPIILEDGHGTVSGTERIAVGQDLSRIFLGSGQVLDTDSFSEIGQLGTNGTPRFGSDPTRIYQLNRTGTGVTVFDSASLAFIQDLDLPCPTVYVRQFIVLPEFGGFLVLGDDKLCATPDDPIFPMALATLASARIDFVGTGHDRIRMTWAFDLAPSSDGLDPANEAVRVVLGTFSQSLPAGSFQCAGEVCKFEGRPPGVTAAFVAEGIASFLVEGVDLAGTENPVSGYLEIGNDFGDTTVRLSGSLATLSQQTNRPGR